VFRPGFTQTIEKITILAITIILRARPSMQNNQGNLEVKD